MAASKKNIVAKWDTLSTPIHPVMLGFSLPVFLPILDSHKNNGDVNQMK